MSRSQVSGDIAQHGDEYSADRRVIESKTEIQEVLDALEDADCRAILDETRTASRSASEVSTHCNLPLSTTYRKLEMLTDAGLLGERTRVSRSGKHASEYSRLIEDVVISVGGSEGMVLEMTYRRFRNPAASVMASASQ